jgi:hypothetical protein
LSRSHPHQYRARIAAGLVAAPIPRYNESVSGPDPISSLMSQMLGPPEKSVVSQLVLAVQPIAVTPGSDDRLAAESEQIRHQGFSAYG